MKRPTYSSLTLGLALALSVINVGLFVFGVQWFQEIRSELSVDSEGEEMVARADAEATDTLRGLVMGACLLGGGALLVTVLRQWKKASRAGRGDALRSYTRNVARADRHR